MTEPLIKEEKTLNKKNQPELVVNNDRTDIERAVIDFVVWFVHDNSKKVALDTFIIQDLRIDGNDSRMFVTALSQRFGIDVRNFPHSDYFHDEKHRHAYSLWRVITQGQPYPVHDLKDLRISDLVQAAEQKVLPPAKKT